MQIEQKQSQTKIILIITAIIAILVVGYLGLAYTQKFWPFYNEPSQDESHQGDNINYSPPTENEVSTGQDAKKDLYDEGNKDQDQPSDKRKVAVGIAFADYDSDEKAFDIRAFTPDVIEGTGECTATLTSQDKKVQQSSRAFVDFSSSQCEPILLSIQNFDHSGTWKLVVSYSSPTSAGESPSMDVEIEL